MTKHVEECMGTVFSIDIRDPGRWDSAIGDVVAWLHRVDAVFSTYKAGSDISRIRRGELAAHDADPDVARVLDLCSVIEAETEGYFTAYWDGRVDPTGLVKGWAIEQASRILKARGSWNHLINGGGDVQIAGEPAPGEAWMVGVSDPLDSTRLLTVVAADTGRDFAIATSGVAERGAHIVDPVRGGPAAELASVTVVGRSLTRVDAFATAAVAMGWPGLSWIEPLGYDALFVSVDGRVATTATFARSDDPVAGRRPVF